MGGVIFCFLLIFAVLVLLTPAMRARAKARERETQAAEEEAIVRRLADRRKWRAPSPDDPTRRD